MSTDKKTTWCRDCYGEGHYLVEVPGGRFDSHMQQWYPHEELEPCSRCFGSGEIWEEELTDGERDD